MSSWDREAACTLNVLTRKGLADLGSTDGPALTAFIHKFFGEEDPDSYDSPGKLIILVSTTPYRLTIDEDENLQDTPLRFNGKTNGTTMQQ